MSTNAKGPFLQSSAPVEKPMQPPQAAQIPYTLTQFGEERIDPYHWLRDPKWQEVLKDPSVLDPAIRAHLEAENAYTQDQLLACDALTRALGDEFAARIIPNEATVPLKDGDWEYW